MLEQQTLILVFLVWVYFVAEEQQEHPQYEGLQLEALNPQLWVILIYFQHQFPWEFEDPKMEVLYHIFGLILQALSRHSSSAKVFFAQICDFWAAMQRTRPTRPAPWRRLLMIWIFQLSTSFVSFVSVGFGSRQTVDFWVFFGIYLIQFL